MRKLSLWLLCVFSLLMSTALLFGQGTSGASSVTGRVTDTSGAVIGGADVTLTDLSTNIPITTQTNAAGLYLFNNVVAGKYTITVSKPGFSKAEVKDQEVLVGAGYHRQYDAGSWPDQRSGGSKNRGWRGVADLELHHGPNHHQ